MQNSVRVTKEKFTRPIVYFLYNHTKVEVDVADLFSTENSTKKRIK